MGKICIIIKIRPIFTFSTKNIRDQIKAKTPLLFSVVPLMVLVSALLQYKKEALIAILIMTSLQLPAIFIAAIIGLFLKILFFGKAKYKFVIEEVNINNKAMK